MAETKEQDREEHRYQELMAMKSGNNPLAIIPSSVEQVFVLAGAIYSSGLAPAGMTKAEQVTVAILMGLELGLPPMQAIQNIAVINGKPSLYGDIGLSLIYASGLLEEFEEGFEGTEALNAKDFPDDFKAWVKMKRKGRPAVREEVSVMDAKRAELWDAMGITGDDKKNKSPWRRYPKKMLRWRARWEVMRALFTDVLKNMQGVEEMSDVVIDVTPSAPAAPTKPRDDISSKLAGGAKVEVVYTSGKAGALSGAGRGGGPRGATEDATDVEVVEDTAEASEAAEQAPAAGETTPQPPSIEVDLTGITDLFEQGAVSELATALVKVDSAARMSVLEDEFNATIDMGSETFQQRMRGMIQARAYELGIAKGDGD